MSKSQLDQLYLTKNERTGIIILLMMLAVLIVIPWLYFEREPHVIKAEDKRFSIANHFNELTIDSLPSDQSTFFEVPEQEESFASVPEFGLFEFDPNHLKANEARKLGIHEKTFRALQNYLATGARIKSPNQLGKIYGLDEKTFRRIEPYIKINNEVKNDSAVKFTKKLPAARINLNTAQSEELMSLPGIGEKLSTRIIKYRNLLGGFINVSQLTEIYGLHDTTIQKLSPMISITGEVQKINLNDLEYHELKKHPYIGAQKASIICEYRKQHPALTGTQELYKIRALDSNWIRRISGYLSFEH